MHRTLTTIAFAIAAAAAAPVLAGEATIEPNTFVSTMSPAEVRAELEQFRRAGVAPWADHYDALQSFRSTLTRAEVTAAYLAARDEVAAMGAEDSGSSWLNARARFAPPPVMARSSEAAAQ